MKVRSAAALLIVLSVLSHDGFAQQSPPGSAKENDPAQIDAKYEAWVATLSPEHQAWERLLQAELGTFYLPRHKEDKVMGRSNAWDFVVDDPTLPRVLLIGDSISRAYTAAVRKELAGRVNLHRAPANCGPTALGIRKMDLWLGDGRWDLIHFNFGIHDRNTPVADYVARLEKIIARLKQTGAILVWASSTPIPDVAEKNWTAASIVERNAAAAELMKREGIAIDDLFAVISPRLDELQVPGDCHFRGAGNDFLGKKVAEAITAILSHEKSKNR